MKPSDSKKTINDKNSKNNDDNNDNNEEEQSSKSDEGKEKVLERFIYITTYNDSNFIEKIRQLFEEINQKAFNLTSPKEIYTYDLTPEDKQNLDIDYISGFQIFDSDIRITIIEGITGKAMQKIKESLPKTQMNTTNHMIFADSTILFNKRLYSEFGLSLKFIKTRDKLEQILTTFDIYLKSVNYRNIYDAFMKIGSILKAETLKEITDADLYPNAQGILALERKYGDILKDEDLTGIKKEKIIKKKYKINTKNINELNKENKIDDENKYNQLNPKSIINKNNPIFRKLVKNAINLNLITNNNNNTYLSNSNKQISQTEPNVSYNKRMLNITPKISAKNKYFESLLEKRENNYKKLLSQEELLKRNIEDIKKMKKKPTNEKFWRPDPNPRDPNKKISFYAIRANHYDEVVNRMREKYIKDKNHFYSYSNYSLALSFPMIDRYRNEEYLKYIENKSKWINKYDFERYKQPEREKIYFPRIKKEI